MSNVMSFCSSVSSKRLKMLITNVSLYKKFFSLVDNQFDIFAEIMRDRRVFSFNVFMSFFIFLRRAMFLPCTYFRQVLLLVLSLLLRHLLCLLR